MSEKLIDKFKYIMGIEEEVDEDNSFEDAKKSQNENGRVAYGQFSKDSQKEEKKIVDFKQKAKLKLVVNEPAVFEDCSKIVDNLRSKKPVIINLEKIETETAKRIFDFVSGATYALNGSIQKVSNNIFVFAPDNIDISSDIQEFKTLSSADLFR